MENLVSIIVPVYKVEKYLDKCVCSILNQSYKNLEIILVNDGSPDNCPQKCDDWMKKDNRIIVLHKENGGVSSARNFGLNNAKGEWVIFVDSDDVVAKDLVKVLIENTISSDMLAVCAMTKSRVQLNKFMENTQIKKYAVDVVYENDNSELKYTHNINFASPWGKLYSLKIINDNQIRFSENIFYGEDYLFNLYYWTKINYIKTVNHMGYYYRVNRESISAKYRNSSYSDEMKANRVLFFKELESIEKVYFQKINKNYHYSDIAILFSQMLSIPLSEIKNQKEKIIDLSRELEKELFLDETAENYSHNRVTLIAKNKIIKYTRSHNYKKLMIVICVYNILKNISLKFC